MLPDSFVTFLQSVSDSKIFLCASAGNSGDLLLQKGLVTYLENKKHILVADAESADIIMIHGGANINDIWKEGIGLLKSMLQTYPDTKIVVAPHTFEFWETNFESILADATAQIHLFARERSSYDCLQSLNIPANISLYLSNDTAFLLEGTKYLDDLIASSTKSYVLYAMRTDRESAILPLDLDRVPQNFFEKGKLILINWKLNRFIKHTNNGNTASNKSILEDISYLPYAEFVEKVQHASEIHTDRLHVGILAALLKKKVYLYPTKYAKVRGVYNQSLKQYTTVEPQFD